MSNIVAVYADGGCILRNPSPYGGTWAYCLVDAAGQRVQGESGVITVAGETVSNNLAEFVAVVMGLEALPAHWSGRVCSDSKVTLGRLFWQWRLRLLPDEWVIRGGEALERLGPLTPVLLDGHPTRAHLAAGIGKRGHPVSEHNVWCDAACGEQAREYLAQRERSA